MNQKSEKNKQEKYGHNQKTNMSHGTRKQGRKKVLLGYARGTAIPKTWTDFLSENIFSDIGYFPESFRRRRTAGF